jgi:hypothetical protein
LALKLNRKNKQEVNQMINEFVVGSKSVANGATVDARADRSGAEVVTNAHGFFMEAVEQGNVYAVANQTGVASQAGLSATTPVLTLANPAGSTKKLAVWYVGCVFNVVFAAIASVFVAVGTNTALAAVTGTLTTAHRNLKLGSGGAPVARTFLAATLPAAPVAIGLLGAGLTGAVVLLPSTPMLERWYNGALILLPGTNLSLQTEAASGAAGMLCEYIWEEVDL